MRRTRQHRTQRALRRQVERERLETWIFYALVVAVILAIAFFVMQTARRETSPQAGSSAILNTINNSPAGFINGDTVNTQALVNFDRNYNRIKQEYGIDSDFYVVFEDQAGNPIVIGNQICHGSQKAAQTNPQCLLS